MPAYASNCQPKRLNKRSSKNRYRFLSFADRIASIKVDVHRKIVRNPIEDNGTTDAVHQSLFYEALKKWRELDATTDFQSFYRNVTEGGRTNSFPLVLYHARDIVDVILKHASLPNSLCRTAVLDLLATLARDIRQEFSQFFETVMTTLIDLLNPQDPQLLESVFACISFIFKYTMKQIVQTLDGVYQRFYFRLLGHEKLYVRKFAAESFAYLIRKLKPDQRNCVFDKVLHWDEEVFDGSGVKRLNLIEGLGSLFFFTLKGTGYSFHSSLHEILPLLLDRVYGHPVDLEYGHEVVSTLFNQIWEHTRKGYCDKVWEALLDAARFSCDKFVSYPSEKHADAFQASMRLLEAACRHRRGQRVENMSLLVPVLPRYVNAFTSVENPVLHLSNLFTLAGAMWTLPDCHELCSSVNAVFALGYRDVSAAIDLVRSVSSSREFIRYFARPAIKLACSIALSSLSDALLLLHAGLSSMDASSWELSRNLVRMPSDEPLVRQLTHLFSKSSHDAATLKDVSLALDILPMIGIPTPNLIQLLSSLQKNCDGTAKFHGAMALSCKSIVATCKLASVCRQVSETLISVSIVAEVWRQLSRHPRHGLLLETAITLLGTQVGISYLASETVSEFANVIGSNLSSCSHSIRNSSLHLLSYFPVLPYAGPSDCPFRGDCDVINQMIRVSESPLDLDHVRESARVLGCLRNMVEARAVPHLYVPLLVQFSLGLLRLKFKLIWPPAQDLLMSLVNSYPEESWHIILTMLAEAARFCSFRSGTETEMDCTREADISLQDDCLSSSANERSTDHVTFNHLLWQSLAKDPAASSKKSKELLSMFIDFMENEHDQVYGSPDWSAEVDSSVVLQFRGAIRGRIVDFLTLFKDIDDLVGFGDVILCRFEQLLSKLDPQIQELSLTCILKFKEESVRPYEEHLRRMIDDATMMDELLMFPLDPSVSDIATSHRTELIPVVFRILYPKLLKRKLQHVKSTLLARRAKIVSYAGLANPDELYSLFDLILSAYRSDSNLESVHGSKHETFFDILPTLLDHLPVSSIQVFLERLLRITISIGSSCFSCAEDPQKPSNERLYRRFVSAFTCILSSFADFTQTDDICRELVERGLSLSHYGAQRLEDGFLTQNKSGILDLIRVLSRYEFLISKLESNPIFLGAACKCLSYKSVSPSVVACVFEIIDNILDLATNSQTINPICNHLISINLDTLLDGMHVVLVQNLKPSPTNDCSSVTFPSTGLQLLSKMMPFVVESTNRLADRCKQLADLLLPYLPRSLKVGQSMKSEDSIVIVLTTMETIVPLMRHEDAHALVLPISSMLQWLDSLRLARQLVSRVLTKVAEHVPLTYFNWQMTASIVCRLNALSRQHNIDDEYDYAQRSAAIEDILLLAQQSELTDIQITPIIYTLFHDLRDKEFGVRGNAQAGLKAILARSGASRRDRLLSVLALPAIYQGLRSARDDVRREFVELFASIVRAQPDKMPDFKVLLHDQDATTDDFFRNVVHIQRHRRRRAFAQLQQLSGLITQVCATRLIIPLATSALLFHDARARDKRKHVALSEKDGPLVDEAMRTLGSMCRLLSWTQYRRVLFGFVKRMDDREEFNRVIVKTICLIVDSFHFNMDECGSDKSKTEAASPNDDDGDDDDGNEILSVIPNTCVTSSSESIRRTIEHSIIPFLLDHVQGKTRFEAIRVSVALAIVKLLQKLPNDVFHRQFPKLVALLCSRLRSKEQAVRDVSRQTLVEIADCVGPKYLWFIVNELASSLTHGLQCQVLSYVIHAIVFKLCQRSTYVGMIDEAIPSIVNILLDDLIGSSADARRNDKIASKSVESRRHSKSLDCFKLLASIVSFPNAIETLIGPIREVTPENHARDALEIATIITNILRHVSEGFTLNPLITRDDLLVFSYRTLDESLQSIVSIRQTNQQPLERGREHGLDTSQIRVSRDERFLVLPEPRQTKRQIIRANDTLTTSHLTTLSWVEFALCVLHRLLKKWCSSNDMLKCCSNDELCDRLNPLIVLLQRCWKGQNTIETTTIALKCISIIIRATSSSIEVLPNMNNVAADLLQFLIIQIQHCTNDLLQISFKTLAIVVGYCTTLEMESQQLRVLLSFVSEYVDNPKSYSYAFPLLKAIVCRKFICDDNQLIGDIMERVKVLLVQSGDHSIVTYCSQILLQYLLDYPLTTKQLSNHLQFLIRNLQFKLQHGRLAVIRFCGVLFTKFPTQIIDQYVDLFFMHLNRRMIIDDSTICRDAIELTLYQLLSNTSHNILNKLIDRILAAAITTSTSLSSSIQCIGIITALPRTIIASHINAFMSVLTHHVKLSYTRMNCILDEDKVDDIHGHWPIAHQCLCVLYKLFTCTAIDDVYDMLQSYGALWMYILELAEYPYECVRFQANKIIQLVIQQQSTMMICDHNKLNLNELASIFIAQLDVADLTIEFSHLISNCLVSIVKLLVLTSCQSSQLQERNCHFFENQTVMTCPLMDHIIHLLSKFGRRSSTILVTKRAVLLIFQGIIDLLQSSSLLDPYIVPIIAPLIIYTSNTDAIPDMRDLQEASQLLLDSIKCRIGDSRYIQAVECIRSHRSNKKTQRQRVAALQCITHPMEAAQLKLTNGQRKREQRQRKVNATKRKYGGGGGDMKKKQKFDA